jgi:hypothetical protein
MSHRIAILFAQATGLFSFVVYTVGAGSTVTRILKVRAHSHYGTLRGPGRSLANIVSAFPAVQIFDIASLYKQLGWPLPTSHDASGERKDGGGDRKAERKA